MEPQFVRGSGKPRIRLGHLLASRRVRRPHMETRSTLRRDGQAVSQLPGVYHAAAWGAPVGHGVSGARLIELHGYAKVHDPAVPSFLVANEYVAHRIGTRLGLPLPPGGLVTDGATAGFATLAFRKRGASAPPVIPESLVAADERLAAGLVVLDVLILNTDRHPGNIGFGELTRRLEIFDHSHAVFGSASPPLSPHWLAISKSALGVEGTVGTRHCLIDHLTDASHLETWAYEADRVLTDRFLEQICREVVHAKLLPDRQLGVDLEGLLKFRRSQARTIMRGHQSQFRSIDPTTWGVV